MSTDALELWLAHVARDRAEALDRARALEDWADRPESLRLVRLAARRLRSVLELLEERAPAGSLKAARRWTRVLGRIRALDVMAALLEEAQSRVGGLAARAASEHLLEDLARARRKARRELGSRLGAPAEVADPGPPPSKPSPRSLWMELAPMLREALEPLEGACRAGDAEALHRIRLATKRLRYALEVTGPAFETAPDQAILALKALQDALGLTHDWTELARYLETHLRACESSRRSALAEGLEVLLAEARREASLGLAQVAALGRELDPLGLATLLRGNLGDLR